MVSEENSNGEEEPPVNKKKSRCFLRAGGGALIFVFFSVSVFIDMLLFDGCVRSGSSSSTTGNNHQRQDRRATAWKFPSNQKATYLLSERLLHGLSSCAIFGIDGETTHLKLHDH